MTCRSLAKARSAGVSDTEGDIDQQEKRQSDTEVIAKSGLSVCLSVYKATVCVHVHTCVHVSALYTSDQLI